MRGRHHEYTGVSFGKCCAPRHVADWDWILLIGYRHDWVYGQCSHTYIISVLHSTCHPAINMGHIVDIRSTACCTTEGLKRGRGPRSGGPYRNEGPRRCHYAVARLTNHQSLSVSQPSYCLFLRQYLVSKHSPTINLTIKHGRETPRGGYSAGPAQSRD